MPATFDDLSPGLLAEVFSHYIESEGHEKFSKNVVPVCSTWWKFSTMPSLWKSVHLRNWNYLMALSNRGIFRHTQSLKLPDDYSNRISLDPNRLLAVLSNIRDLKAVEISSYFIDENTMKIVAEHCPNLERLRLVCLSRAGNEPITLEELGTILAKCGPKLKHLHLSWCDIEDSEQVISEIAAKCASLEVFELFGFSKFPIYKIIRGCPRLRKLTLFGCKLVTTGGNDCSGLRDLTSFAVFNCNLNGLDICSLLKNSNNLKHLELCCSANFIFSNVLMIPSNKVEFLGIWLRDYMDLNFIVLRQAVDKWKHTLLHLEIPVLKYDCTSILRTYLFANLCPKLEVLKIDEINFDRAYLKKVVQRCQNLKELRVYAALYKNREDILKFVNLV